MEARCDDYRGDSRECATNLPFFRATPDMDPRPKDALKKIDERTGSYDHLPWEEKFRRVIKDLEQLVQFSRQLKEAPTDDHVIKFFDEVSPPWSDSDDSDEEFSWQDNATEEYLDDDCLDELRVLLQDDLSEESSPDKSSLQQKDETMDEQSDDEFWEDFEQEGYEEQTPKEYLSPIQPKVKSPISECDDTNNKPLCCQVNPHVNQYEDPFWEASCQKQLDEPTRIMEYLKDLFPKIPNPYTHSAKKQNTNRSDKWCATLPGGSHKGKSVSPVSKWVPKTRPEEASTSEQTPNVINVSNAFDVLQEVDGGSEEGNKHVIESTKEVSTHSTHTESEPTVELLDSHDEIRSSPVTIDQESAWVSPLPTVGTIKDKGVRISEPPSKPNSGSGLSKEKGIADKPPPPLKSILKHSSRFSAASMDGGGRKEGVDNKRKGAETVRSSLEAVPNPKHGFWNIRGLNASEKQQEVRSFIRNQNLFICAILESHLRLEALSPTCERIFGRWSWITNQANSEIGTRVIVAWDASIVDDSIKKNQLSLTHFPTWY
ncbi:hypothetical protein OSB04_un001713 [Centaurea solstitialis]|uniref:Uncharacterized protein n=1 Tax=Centaurea solstitialis TaxID=347529 RepID=A0AA38VQM9_9ASTR|nr:hypothetical protein OSB04_un001713 [Centaurea solstitialis]